LSFYPSKNLGGFGYAGMVVNSDSVLAEKLRLLRVHGSKPKYQHSLIGGNFRLDAIQAAILKVKLRHLDKWTRKRQGNACFYERAFIRQKQVRLPRACWKASRDTHYHIYNQYVVRVCARDNLQSYLKQSGIGTE